MGPPGLFLTNYAFILIARVLRISVGLLLLFGVARYLPVVEFGDFLFVINLAASVMTIAFYGIGQAMVRDVSADSTLERPLSSEVTLCLPPLSCLLLSASSWTYVAGYS
ncbi:MAG: hypothetical protein SFH39_02560 [Candidatus Magnetobacterium sp. LHC-1]|nr:oligosaccharide flippase family protein [Nitrospirota bacterium]